jgi:hypothetical protein
MLLVLLLYLYLMMSQWYELKDRAVSLRKQGLSIREIESLLSIPRSTLSGWFKGIELTNQQKLRLKQNSDLALVKARAKASEWHRTQKVNRLAKAEAEANVLLNRIELSDDIIELALAMLYLGEGARFGTTAIGNSNPLIMKFFLSVLLKKYEIDLSKIRFDLHIRADQDPNEVKEYWAQQLGVPISSFKYVAADQRTAGRTTYPHYHGVCIINCGNVAIQRKLIYLYQLFCQKVIDSWAVSSFG